MIDRKSGNVGNHNRRVVNIHSLGSYESNDDDGSENYINT